MKPWGSLQNSSDEITRFPWYGKLLYCCTTKGGSPQSVLFYSSTGSIRDAKSWKEEDSQASSTSVSMVNLRWTRDASRARSTSRSLMAATSFRCCSRILPVLSGAAESRTSILIAVIPFSDISRRLSNSRQQRVSRGFEDRGVKDSIPVSSQGASRGSSSLWIFSSMEMHSSIFAVPVLPAECGEGSRRGIEKLPDLHYLREDLHRPYVNLSESLAEFSGVIFRKKNTLPVPNIDQSKSPSAMSASLRRGLLVPSMAASSPFSGQFPFRDDFTVRDKGLISFLSVPAFSCSCMPPLSGKNTD